MLSAIRDSNSEGAPTLPLETLERQRAELCLDLGRLSEQILVSVCQLRSLAAMKPETANEYLSVAEELESSFAAVKEGLLETLARLDQRIEARRLN